jgi:putative oxidoreductase
MSFAGRLDNSQAAASETAALHDAKVARTVSGEWLVILYVRLALATPFLSAVADRFGLWGKYGGWGNFGNFEKYTGEVNSFLPASIIPFLAWTATIAELSLGLLLILGLWTRWVAFSAAALLFLFGISMAISFGLKSPLDYSVFSASAAALLLALYGSRRSGAGW